MSEAVKSSVVEGLAAYKARKAAEEERREAAQAKRDAGRISRFSLAQDGDSVVFRFAQEIDHDAHGYDADRGIGFVNIEHNHPDPINGWKNRGNCSTDSQGACYPCERVQDYSVEWNDRKGWKQKEKFYINVIAGPQEEVTVKLKSGKKQDRKLNASVDEKTGDGEVFLLEQGTYNGIWNSLVVAAVEDETIVDTLWRIDRKGSEFNDTSYTLTRLHKKPTDKMKDLSEFELINIKEVVLKEVPYAQQEAYYHRNIDGGDGVAVDEAKETAPVTAGAGTTGTESAW